MSHKLQSYSRFVKLFDFYKTRHPEMEDSSAIFKSVMEQYDPVQNLALAKHYVGFIHRYRDALVRIPFTQAEWALLEECLIDLELELVLSLCEAQAASSRNHSH